MYCFHRLASLLQCGTVTSIPDATTSNLQQFEDVIKPVCTQADVDTLCVSFGKDTTTPPQRTAVLAPLTPTTSTPVSSLVEMKVTKGRSPQVIENSPRTYAKVVGSVVYPPQASRTTAQVTRPQRASAGGVLMAALYGRQQPTPNQRRSSLET